MALLKLLITLEIWYTSIMAKKNKIQSLAYLASPYSHKDKKVRLQRFNAVSEAVVKLLHKGVYTFSPIAYNHPMVIYNLPTDWDFWEKYDVAFLERCDELIVLTLKGWKKSVGVNAEIEIAKKLGVKVTYLDPKDI